MAKDYYATPKNTAVRRYALFHDEFKGKKFLHQSVYGVSPLDQFVEVISVYDNDTARVRGEKGETFLCPLKTLKEIY